MQTSPFCIYFCFRLWILLILKEGLSTKEICPHYAHSLDFMIDNMWCYVLITSTLYKLDTSLDGKLVTFMMVSSLELTAYTDLQKHH